MRLAFSIARVVKTLPVNRYFDDGDDEGTGEGTGTGNGEGTGTGTGTGEGTGNSNRDKNKADKTFNQAEVDRIVTQRLRKQKEETDKLVGEIEKFKQQGATPENVEALNSQLEKIRDEGKTREQLAAEEKGKLEKKFKTEISNKDQEINTWKDRYIKYRTQTDTLTAASKYKAHNGEQVYKVLRPDMVMEDEIGDDGKPTGEHIPKVNFRAKDDTGKPVTLKLSVEDAVKRMTEMDEHQNLFDSGATGGLGSRNKGRNGGTGSTAIPTDTKSYMEQRKKNPNLLKTAGEKA